MLDFELLQQFIIQAKSYTYVGSGQKSLAYRPDSNDLQFREGDFAYLDSYSGLGILLGEKWFIFKAKPFGQ